MNGRGICEGCPLLTVIEAAEELAKGNPHNELEKTLGGIAITKQSLQLLCLKIACPGPISGEGRQLDCPLRDNVYAVRTLGAVTWNQTQFGVRLDKVLDQSGDASTGHYL